MLTQSNDFQDGALPKIKRMTDLGLSDGDLSYSDLFD